MGAARRLFFALWPDPGVRRQLEALARALPTRWRAVASADLHLTVLFLGAVAEDQLEPLCRAVDPLRVAAFDQALTRLETWAGGALCCCSGNAHEALTGLHRALASAAGGVGLELERREYRPHVTLARARRSAPGPAARTLDAPLHLHAQALVLAESAGHPVAGPRYHPLRVWPFGTHAAGSFRINK